MSSIMHTNGLATVSQGERATLDFSDYDPPALSSPTTEPEQRAADYLAVRRFSHQLARPLAIEDYVVQTMVDVSPTKWHLAHTTWFFERFLLHHFVRDYQPLHEPYYYLFNSYYNGAGPQHCRAGRGLISRPTVEEVYAYRHTIDQRMLELILNASPETLEQLRHPLTVGINHEQQHQELILTDLKHVYSSNPLLPAYAGIADDPPASTASIMPGQFNWTDYPAGIYHIGDAGDGFAFDNERPRHRVFLEAFQLAHRPVCNAEMIAFIEDAGYQRPELWLSEGYAKVREVQWAMPVYWYRQGEQWMHYTLTGPRPLDPAEPVSHLSYFEADALARWLGARLPREAEWEVAASDRDTAGHFADAGRFHPQPLTDAELHSTTPVRMMGDLWEWTMSAYDAYPGYQFWQGTLGEYNGKFMCNQYVLRGGSCATPAQHIRATYRNFFPTDARWQFTSLRLAR